MGLLQEAWKQFEQGVMPVDAGDVQRQEMRRAFFAGAWTVHCELMRIGQDHITEAEGQAVLTDLHREFVHYQQRIGNGE